MERAIDDEVKSIKHNNVGTLANPHTKSSLMYKSILFSTLYHLLGEIAGEYSKGDNLYANGS